MSAFILEQEKAAEHPAQSDGVDSEAVRELGELVDRLCTVDQKRAQLLCRIRKCQLRLGGHILPLHSLLAE